MFYKILIIILFNNIILSQSFVDKFISHYENSYSYKVEFDYLMIVNDKILTRNNGTIMFSKNKYRLIVDEALFIYDGNKYYNIINENKEVNVSKENEFSNYIIPTKLSEILMDKREKISIIKLEDMTLINFSYDIDVDYKIFVKPDYSISKIDQYFSNGNIYYNGFYTDDLKSGLWHFFTNDGRTDTLINYNE